MAKQPRFQTSAQPSPPPCFAAPRSKQNESPVGSLSAGFGCPASSQRSRKCCGEEERSESATRDQLAMNCAGVMGMIGEITGVSGLHRKRSIGKRNGEGVGIQRSGVRSQLRPQTSALRDPREKSPFLQPFPSLRPRVLAPHEKFPASGLFPEFACPAVASHPLRLSSKLITLSASSPVFAYPRRTFTNSSKKGAESCGPGEASG